MAKKEDNTNRRDNQKTSRTNKAGNQSSTDSEHIAKKLRQQSRFINAIVETTGALVVVLDTEGKIVLFNRACEKITKYSYAEVKNKYLWDFILLPEEIKPVKSVFQKLQSGMFPSQFENYWIGKDGASHYITWSNTVLIDDSGKVSYVIGTGIEITDRKNTEEALYISESRYRELFEAVMEGIGIVDENEVIQYCNPAFEKIFEMDSGGSLIGRSLFDFISGDQKELLILKTEQRRQNIPSRYELRIKTLKNNFRVVQVSSSPRFDPSGKYIGAFGTIIDLTEKHLAERALKNSIQSYQTLAENLPGLVYRVLSQESSRIIFFNDLLESLTGYTEDEFPGNDLSLFESMIDERDRQAVYSEVRQAVAEKRPFELGYRFTHKTKGLRHFVERGRPVFDSAGNLKSIDGVIFDFTHHIEVEESIKEAHIELGKQYQARTEELKEVNLRKKAMFDLYNIFELSRNFNAMLNYQSLLDSFILAAMGRAGAKQAALFLPLKPGEKDFHLVKSGGGFSLPNQQLIINQHSSFCLYIANLNRPIKVTEAEDKFELSKESDFIENFPNGLVVPLVYQTKLRGILVLSEKESGLLYQDNDIEFLSILASQTAVSIENVRLFESEKEAMDKLQKTQGLLLQSERSAALGELSAKVAHEINNPLGIIKNYLSLVDQNITDADKSLGYTQIIKQEIDRIALIVKQLLNFHRPVAVSFDRVNPEKLISDILLLMDSQFINAGVIATCHTKDNIPDIFAWSDGLKQIFMNLLVNSIDAMKSGGEIIIDLKRTEHTVIFSFEDGGPGIEAGHIPHIFDPYYTTKSRSGGSGLGLSVCYNIIKNHNGSINYTNSKRGGCFIIELPIEQGENKYDWHI